MHFQGNDCMEFAWKSILTTQITRLEDNIFEDANT